MTHLAALQDAQFLLTDLHGLLARRRRSPTWWIGIGIDGLQHDEVAITARLLQLGRALHDAPPEVLDLLSELDGCVHALLSGAAELTEGDAVGRSTSWFVGIRAWLRHGAHHDDALRACRVLDDLLSERLRDVPRGDASLFADDDGAERSDRVRSRRLSSTRVTAAG